MEENEVDKDCYKLVPLVLKVYLGCTLSTSEMFQVNVYFWQAKLFLPKLFEI